MDDFTNNQTYFKNQFFPQNINAKPNNSNNLGKYGRIILLKTSFVFLSNFSPYFSNMRSIKFMVYIFIYGALSINPSFKSSTRSSNVTQNTNLSTHSFDSWIIKVFLSLNFDRISENRIFTAGEKCFLNP